MQENSFFLKKPLGKSGKHLYYPAHTAPSAFPGSSAVEHSTVNRQVAGSNPARGATFFHRTEVYNGAGAPGWI